MTTDSQFVPLEARRIGAWFIGTGVVVVFPLAFAVNGSRSWFWVVLLACMATGGALGALIYTNERSITRRIRSLPPPMMLAIAYPAAVWIAVTIEYTQAVDPDRTPQMVWSVGMVALVWIGATGASLREGAGWFRFFSFVFWVCCALTILFYGIGLLFVPLALAYGSAYRQRADSA